MPELPEVETVRRGLETLLAGAPVIEKFEFRRADLRDVIPVDKIRRLEGAALKRVSRRAKYLLFETDRGTLISHLGMTGSWRASTPGDERTHDHFFIQFAGGLRLAYHDPRRFGILDWLDGELERHPRFHHLGPEPWNEKFETDALWALCKARSSPIKNTLMDATVVVGVGNIYASEVLHRVGVRPGRRSNKITRNEAASLVTAVREVLAEAITAGGSSISDYVQANGESGSFQLRFKVYDREGQPCRECGTPIRRQVHAGRSSYYCPRCQR